MNCSQLLEKRVTTNWEKPSQLHRELSEDPGPQSTDSYRWVAVRSSSMGQTLAPRIVPAFKPFAH
jgi:hypothetical protein